MRTKFLVFVMSLLLVVGFSPLALADWVTDTTGDTLISGFDITAAKVEVYPTTADVDDYMNICLQMDNKLPGCLMMEFDVDGSSETGGGSGMCALFFGSCLNLGTPIKPALAGLDLTLSVFFDDQSNTAPTAWCIGCLGPGGQCFYKTTQCAEECSQTEDCFEGGLSCKPGAPNCYLAGDMCQPEGHPECDGCFEMTDNCSDQNPCGYGKKVGEWYATNLDPAQMGEPFIRGRLDLPTPPRGGPDGTESEVCIKLPWKKIVYEAVGDPWPSSLDIDDAKNSNNLKWSGCALEDNSTGGNDWMCIDPMCMETVDAIPNVGTSPAQLTDGGSCHSIQTHFHNCMANKAIDSGTCTMDAATVDGTVNLAELNELKVQFFKSDAACDE